MSSTLQSGVRFQALPTPELRRVIAQWIGCQRVIYNGKVSEDRLYAAERRMDLEDYPFNPLPTPLDRCYAQFKDRELTPYLYDVPSQVLRIGADRWWDGKQRQLKGLAKAPTIRNKNNFNSVVLSNELFWFTDIIDPVTGEIKRHLVLGTVNNPIGILDFKAHREYGEPKQIVIRRTGRHWSLSFSYEHAAPLGYVERSDEELAYELKNLTEAELRVSTLGFDRNVKDNFIATNDGRFFKISDVQEDRIDRKAVGAKKLQKKMAHQVKGSANRAKTIRKLGANFEYASHVRDDFSHQTSHALVRKPANDAGLPKLVAMEDIKVLNLVKKPKAKQDKVSGKWLKNGRKAKSALAAKILAACWGRIKTQVYYKAKRNNCLVLAVAPQYTSQECSHCGHIHSENRDKQLFNCKRCGFTEHADTNAGKNIRNRAVKKVLAGEVVNKTKKRCAWRRRMVKNIGLLGRESPSVPVESCKTQTGGFARDVQDTQRLVEAGTFWNRKIRYPDYSA
jgi:putative transposase